MERKPADHQDETQPEATLAHALIERAGRARALLSPWTRRWLRPERRRPLPPALSLPMNQALHQRLQRQFGRSQVWQPDAGSLPEMVAHFTELIVHRYESSAGKYAVQPAPEEAAGPELVLPGAGSIRTKRSPEGWLPATPSFAPPVAMDPGQSKAPFPGTTTQAGIRRRSQKPRPTTGIRPLSRVEEVTPGGRSQPDRSPVSPPRTPEKGEEVDRAAMALTGQEGKAAPAGERLSPIRPAPDEEDSAAPALAAQEDEDEPPVKGPPPPAIPPVDTRPAGKTTARRQAKEDLGAPPSRSPARSRLPSPAPGQERTLPDISIVAKPPEPSRAGRQPPEEEDVGPLTLAPEPAPATPETGQETGRPAEQPPEARRPRPDRRPPDSDRAKGPGVKPAPETPDRPPAEKRPAVPAAEDVAGAAAETDLVLARPQPVVQPPDSGRAKGPGAKPAPGTPDRPAAPAAGDVAGEVVETDLILARPPFEPPAGEPEAKDEVTLTLPTPARPKPAPLPPSPPEPGTPRPAPSPPEAPPVEAAADRPEPTLADHLLSRAAAKIALPLAAPSGPERAPESGAATRWPPLETTIRPKSRVATLPAGQPAADRPPFPAPVLPPAIQERLGAGLVTRMMPPPKIKPGPVAGPPLVLARRPAPSPAAAGSTVTTGAIQRAVEGTAPLPTPLMPAVIQRQIEADGQRPGPTGPAVEPAPLPDLDQLARQVYPFVCRLLKVERERSAGR